MSRVGVTCVNLVSFWCRFGALYYYFDVTLELPNVKFVIIFSRHPETIDHMIQIGSICKMGGNGNYIGGGDGAVLFVGATLFVYDGEASFWVGSCHWIRTESLVSECYHVRTNLFEGYQPRGNH